MLNGNPLARETLDKLRRFDTCTVSNAIERFSVRLRNEGFMHGAAQCQFPHLPPILGYAVTGRIRSSVQPITGGCYFDHMDWWRHVATIPAPRVVVMQDIDDYSPGLGAWVGEVHAYIFKALDCAAYITNGAVRDLEAVEATGLQLFAGSVAVSHAYAHVVEFGLPVEVGGLKVHPGDLLHGDRHGVHAIPPSIAGDIPSVAEELIAKERALIDLCKSRNFSLDNLASAIGELVVD